MVGLLSHIPISRCNRAAFQPGRLAGICQCSPAIGFVVARNGAVGLGSVSKMLFLLKMVVQPSESYKAVLRVHVERHLPPSTKGHPTVLSLTRVCPRTSKKRSETSNSYPNPVSQCATNKASYHTPSCCRAKCHKLGRHF